MNCLACQRLLSQRQDGELSPRLVAAVDEHVAGCAACAQVAAELRAVTDGLRGLAGPEPSPALWGRIDVELAREAQARRARRSLMPLLAPVLGGLALLSTATGAWLLQADARRRQAAVDAELVRASAASLREVEERWEAAEAEAARLSGAAAPARPDRVLYDDHVVVAADELEVQLAARSRRFFEATERSLGGGASDPAIPVEPLRDPWPVRSAPGGRE